MRRFDKICHCLKVKWCFYCINFYIFDLTISKIIAEFYFYDSSHKRDK
jgi:hypothetical protein